MKKKSKKRRKLQFSKLLILFETALVTLTTVGGIILAFLSVKEHYEGSLPWVVTMVSLAWGAYGFSAKCYYAKAMTENSKGGITYDMAFRAMEGEKEHGTDY